MTNKIKVNLFDLLTPIHFDEFWGFHSFSPEYPPTAIEWVKEGHGVGKAEFDGVTVFTDKSFAGQAPDSVKSKYKVAWLIECRGVHPRAYEAIINFEDKFDYILQQPYYSSWFNFHLEKSILRWVSKEGNKIAHKLYVKTD